MKKNFIHIILLVGVGSLFLTSCKKDKEPVTPEDPQIIINKYVNTWIKEEMESYYLWNNKIPSSLDNKVSPDAYFNSMLYSYDKNLAPDGDRFSWIQEDYTDLLGMLSGVTTLELGFEYNLFLYNEKDIFGEFAYIKKNTDAAARGLKRGQAFTHINNTKLTTDNYRTLLSDASQAASVALRVYDPTIDLDKKIIYFDNEQNIAINLLSKYAENPVYLDSVYTVNGKNIGYLVYNFFAADANDYTNSYDLALNSVFEKFKNKGVDNLVLDLRYNSGGSVLSAIYLSSMIVKNLNTGNVFCKMEYNPDYQKYIVGKYGQDYLLDYFEKTIEVYSKDGKLTSEHPLHNIGNLQTLYVLTGKWTASASEMIINGLQPYMNVYLIGGQTIGKNVASTTFYKANDSKNKWGLQPIIAKFYNSLGKSDFTAGFIPDILDEDSWNMPKKQLGEIDEALLGAAIACITGETKSQAPSTRSMQSVSFVREVGSTLNTKPWGNQIIIDNR